MVFPVIAVSLMLLTGWFWRAADRQAKAVRYARARFLVRAAFAGFFLSMLLYPLVPLSRAILDTEPEFPPAIWSTPAYLWLPVILPLTFLFSLPWQLGRWILRRRSRPVGQAATRTSDQSPKGLSEADQSPSPSQPSFSRRDAIRLAAASIPPLATCGLSLVCLAERGGFRVREVVRAIRTLPADLDGLTICHVSDTHVGNFFPYEAVNRVADAILAMKTDLVVFTGDLIDRGLLDRIPVGLKLFENLDRFRLGIIEGNHDIQANADEFEQAIREAKLPFLLDDQMICRVSGRSTPIQLLGITWGESMVDSEMGMKPRPLRKQSMEATVASVQRVAAMRRPGAFPILLAHHPHAFDPAVEAKIPLTLSGHTHGGQVMLTKNIGAGPIRFRYWSGEHERDGSHLIISNGLGSWFPLRVNAPPEILKITLRRG